jgi:PAS domain S-box-containing protein
MKGALKESSIRVKLSVLTLLNCSIALLLAGICLFTCERYQQRQAAEQELIFQADLLAQSSAAPLSLHDQLAATQTLAALQGDPKIVEAVIYDRNAVPFAGFNRAGASYALSAERPRAEGAYFEDNCLFVFEPINLAGKRIGAIFIRATYATYALLLPYVGIVFVVMLTSLTLTLLIGWRTQNFIANPITALSILARRVSIEKDYSVRAERSTGGEIGVLIDSFNDMLSQIEALQSARDQAEESLRESEERYALAARGAKDGLWDWKLPSDEIYFSPRWYQMLGYMDSENWCNPAEWFSLIHPSDRDRVIAAAVALRDGPSFEMACEYRMHHKNGAFIWVLTRGIAIRDERGNAVRMAGSQTDITEGKIADPLTALPNRLYFIDRLDSAIASTGAAGSPFAVLFLDLDKFKIINDSMGHAAGDELLMGVAARVSSAVRSAARFAPEISPSGQPGAAIRSIQPVIARLGGDEFAILVTDISCERDASAVAERILEKLKAPFTIYGRQVFASASIGIALSSPGNTQEDIMRNADTAMYRAKAAGNSRFRVFDEHMRELAVSRLATETDLRKAIEAGQLVVYYQPEVCLDTGRTIGFEALVRWNHPKRGLLGPEDFIPVAEESDLIILLGSWVMEEACRQMAKWHLSFSSQPPFTISINVSPKQFHDPTLVDDLLRILAKTGMNPDCLKLEMTESSFMENPVSTLATLRLLKSMNIGLEIDDFGTGYSSLGCLHLLPFDTVKINRSFVRELGVGQEGGEIVRTIIKLARSLRMKVVAEGVETTEQLTILASLGCDYAQGFFFSKPKPARFTERFIEERNRLHRGFKMLQGATPVPPRPEENPRAGEPSWKPPALV